MLMVGLVAALMPDAAAADKIATKDERGIGAGASTPDAPEGRRARPRAHRHSAISCAYHDPAAAKLPGIGNTFPRATPGPEGGTFVRICMAPDGTEVTNRVVELPPRPPLAPTPRRLAEEALDYTPLPLPDPITSPDDWSTIVNFPTWLAVADWSPATAEAAVSGLATTVVAAPLRAVWDMGDGTEVVCAGPGRRYDFSVPDDEQSTDCSHIYRVSSAGMGRGDTYEASVTVVYRVTWSATDGSGGDLGELPVTRRFPMEVGEVQALVVGHGGRR
ncbi:MAG: hypothetical protein M3P53_08975 [Actinomycetota bacterium]|nr:hypothetical protein [Actinomycetota bacterium]